MNAHLPSHCSIIDLGPQSKLGKCITLTVGKCYVEVNECLSIVARGYMRPFGSMGHISEQQCTIRGGTTHAGMSWSYSYTTQIVGPSWESVALLGGMKGLLV